MMRKLYRAGYIMTILFSIGIFLALVYRIKIIDSNGEKPNIVNLIRVKVNPEYNLIQNNWPLTSEAKGLLKNELDEKEVAIAVANLEGTITYEYNSLFETGSKIDLTEHLYNDHSYEMKNDNKYLISFPVYDGEKVAGFAIFSVPLKGVVTDDAIPTEWYVVIAVFSILWLCSVILTIVTYYKKKFGNPFEDIVNGLEQVTKGIYKPLKLPKELDHQPIYISYNRMVEELSYLIKKQKSYEGKRKSFLTTIGHELKTPLATINAYIEGLVSGVAKDDQTIENYQRIIQEKMQGLMGQVDDLFRYAQDDMDQFKYHFEEVYADDVFSKIINPLAAKEHKRKIMIQDQIPKCMINVDVIRIEQVILNLYNNAIKHTKKDGQLTIQGYRQENELLISLEDNGEGINPKDLTYIFDVYYQGNTSKKKDYEGIGLGLAICKEIVNKHGGRIYVKSKVGKGTKISFTIPIV